MSETDLVIDVRHLTRRFGEFVAVRDVSLQVRRGAIFGLLGPNGSGKSTMIRMMLGILPLSDGEAIVLGRDAYIESESIKPRVGYMSQHFSLYADLTVNENLDFYGRIYGLDAKRLAERKKAVMDLTGIGHYVEQLAGNLSGGWKQRLALACSLIHEPDLLFLDEPTAGIDPVARRHLWDLLFELSARGVTLVVTTHYMDEAERCTDVGYLYESRLLILGKPEQLKRLPQITPEGTRRFELRIARAAEHLSRLLDQPGVRDATLFGETLHLLLEDRVSPETLKQHLGMQDEKIELRPIPPSLEDVFVTLTADAEKEGGGQLQEKLARKLTGEQAPPEPELPPRTKPKRKPGKPLSGLWAVLVKEFYHIRRQPITLFFMLVVPVMQTIIFGYAINIKIEHIPMVVLDLDGRQHSRDLISAFVNTRKFQLLESVHDDESFHRAITSGRAKVGLRIPPYYSDRLLRGEQVEVQVLIDGSDSQVATTAQSTAGLLGLNLSLGRTSQFDDTMQIAPARSQNGDLALPIDMRTRLLYNPDLDIAHFFVPGLVGIILQLVTLFLT